MVYRCFYRDLPPVGTVQVDFTDCDHFIKIWRGNESQIIIMVADGGQFMAPETFELPTLEDDPTPREKCQCIFTIGYNVGVARLAAIDPDEIF
jgi:hypothetical protein